MSLDAVAATDLKYGAGFYLKALLIGEAGGGKTTAAATLPGKTLFLDWDGGGEVLYGLPNVDLIQYKHEDAFQRWLQNLAVMKEIKYQVSKGTFPYDTVVGDSLSMLYEMAMGLALNTDSQRGPGGSEVSNHYRVEKREARAVWEYFLHAPINFIATVHEAHDKDEFLNRIFYFPTVRGQDSPLVVRRFREVYQCFTRPAKDKDGKEIVEYFWRTSPEPQRPYLKSSLNTGGKYWTAVVGPNPNFTKLLAVRKIDLKLKEVKSVK